MQLYIVFCPANQIETKIETDFMSRSIMKPKRRLYRMEIVQKLAARAADNWNAGAVTIAFLGDSVTQGCFELYKKSDGSVETYFDKNSAIP